MCPAVRVKVSAESLAATNDVTPHTVCPHPAGDTTVATGKLKAPPAAKPAPGNVGITFDYGSVPVTNMGQPWTIQLQVRW